MTRAADLDRVEAILKKACGLCLSVGLKRALQSSFTRAAKAAHLDEQRFLDGLCAGDEACLAQLVEHSVIGETYFFRHPEQFAAFKDLLQKDFASERALRIWSAGCASGEEAYSIAMALADAGRARGGDRIVATDVSAKALAVARAGLYGRWSLRRLDPRLRERYFVAAGDKLQVSEAVQKSVEFSRHNMVLEPPPLREAHFVFCRNVLIYFSPETAAHVLRGLCEALVPGGYLVLGPVEVPQAAVLSLEWVETHGVTLLRKPDGKARPAAPHPATIQRRVTPHPSPKRRATPAPMHAHPAPVSSPPPPPPSPPRATRFEKAREAAREGRLEEAERLARGAAAEEMSPESYLLLSMAAESRGDLSAAVDQVRKALYLEPSLATGHAFLVALFHRLGRPQEAERARRNALDALEGLDEACVLQGVEAITAGALRRALEPATRR